MNFPTSSLLVRWAILMILPSQILPQSKNATEEVRDAFLVTRVKVPAEKQVKPIPAKSPKPGGRANFPLGLGYTVYQGNAVDTPVRVAETHEFHQGDKVRLVIESNVDGHLYVFY